MWVCIYEFLSVFTYSHPLVSSSGESATSVAAVLSAMRWLQSCWTGSSMTLHCYRRYVRPARPVDPGACFIMPIGLSYRSSSLTASAICCSAPYQIFHMWVSASRVPCIHVYFLILFHWTFLKVWSEKDYLFLKRTLATSHPFTHYFRRLVVNSVSHVRLLKAVYIVVKVSPASS